MKNLKAFIFFMLLIPFTACAISQKVELRGVTGRLLPNPSYTFFDTQKKGYSITFYFAALKGIQDLDGSTQFDPDFLTLYDVHTIDIKKYKKVILVVDVWNEQLRPFYMSERTKILYTNGVERINYRKAGEGRLQFRSYSFELPLQEAIKRVEYSLEFHDDEANVIFMTGDFNYKIKLPEKDKE